MGNGKYDFTMILKFKQQIFSKNFKIFLFRIRFCLSNEFYNPATLIFDTSEFLKKYFMQFLILFSNYQIISFTKCHQWISLTALVTKVSNWVQIESYNYCAWLHLQLSRDHLYRPLNMMLKMFPRGFCCCKNGVNVKLWNFP